MSGSNPDGAQVSAVRNAMTVDVEDYFQVSAFEDVVSYETWDRYDCRIPRNVERILELFEVSGARATFFILGWVAERYPQLVRRIAAAGHEVASHGYRHTRVKQQDPDRFREDVRRSKGLLEDAIGRPVLGYRAASYSIDGGNLWAHGILAECGHRYSSSVYPIRHDLYGMPDAPRFPYDAGGILEIPVTTVELGGRRFACGGGGFFRLYPYALSRWALTRVNRVDRQPGIFYFHPWEIDVQQPRVSGTRLKSRFRHYLNLARMEPRLKRLLRDFVWDTVDGVFLGDRARIGSETSVTANVRAG